MKWVREVIQKKSEANKGSGENVLAAKGKRSFESVVWILQSLAILHSSSRLHRPRPSLFGQNNNTRPHQQQQQPKKLYTILLYVCGLARNTLQLIHGKFVQWMVENHYYGLLAVIIIAETESNTPPSVCKCVLWRHCARGESIIFQRKRKRNVQTAISIVQIQFEMHICCFVMALELRLRKFECSPFVGARTVLPWIIFKKFIENIAGCGKWCAVWHCPCNEHWQYSLAQAQLGKWHGRKNNGQPKPKKKPANEREEEKMLIRAPKKGVRKHEQFGAIICISHAPTWKVPKNNGFACAAYEAKMQNSREFTTSFFFFFLCSFCFCSWAQKYSFARPEEQKR